jgi:hypothetical protein
MPKEGRRMPIAASDTTVGGTQTRNKERKFSSSWSEIRNLDFSGPNGDSLQIF